MLEGIFIAPSPTELPTPLSESCSAARREGELATRASRRDAEHLFDVVARLRSEGASVIWIGHFLEEIQRVADRWTVLRDGATVGTGDVADTDPSTWVTLMAGRAVEEFFPPRTPTVGDVLLELDELEGSPAPKAASLSLRRGEILGPVVS